MNAQQIPAPPPTDSESVPGSVEQQLKAEPFRFSFFQSVRILERLWKNRTAVGKDASPLNEVVRFKAHQSLQFPASEINHLEAPPADTDVPWKMIVTFMGLTGPSGALPRSYTTTILERARERDFALRDFLDLFNHRLISLFYRAWEKYRFWLGYERAEQTQWQVAWQDPQMSREFELRERPRQDLFSDILLNLSGLGSPALRYRLSDRERLISRRTIDDETLRYYAGLLSQQRRSAIGLEALLSDFFGVPVQVQQLYGQWLRLDREYQTQLVSNGNIELGVTAFIGERLWDTQSKFRIRIGPLNYEQFQRFLPTGSAYQPLSDLARLYAGQEFDIDTQLILMAREVPPCQLGIGTQDGTRLGYDMWSRLDEFVDDRSEAVFVLHDQPANVR
jgi:type VI secretion system protein ImpH